MTTKKRLNSVNPKKESLTPEKLRTFSGCENYTTQQAEELVLNIKIFCSLLFEYFQNKNAN